MTERLSFERRIPGTWIDLPDREASFEIGSLVSAALGAFDEATMALILFEQAQASTPRLSREQREADARRESEILQALETREGARRFEPAWWQALHAQASREFMLEKWRAGRVPDRIRHRMPFIFAKAFLYATDTIGKLLAKLAERGDISDSTKQACQAFYDSFPQLRKCPSPS